MEGRGQHANRQTHCEHRRTLHEVLLVVLLTTCASTRTRRFLSTRARPAKQPVIRSCLGISPSWRRARNRSRTPDVNELEQRVQRRRGGVGPAGGDAHPVFSEVARKSCFSFLFHLVVFVWLGWSG